jgi:hypothetical protein
LSAAQVVIAKAAVILFADMICAMVKVEYLLGQGSKCDEMATVKDRVLFGAKERKKDMIYTSDPSI